MIYLDWHLGLGDAILCNGLVRYLAKSEAILLPCYARNLPTVRHMFSDLDNVVVHEVVGDSIPQEFSRWKNVLSIGTRNPRWGTVEPWDRAFYEFAGVPFDAKWDFFHVPESDTAILFPGPPMPIVHDDERRGLNIDPLRTDLVGTRVLRMFPRTDKLTDWGPSIEVAPQIHVIDSAPMHLVELLPTTGKLFYHKYARAKGNRHHSDAVTRKDWTVLE